MEPHSRPRLPSLTSLRFFAAFHVFCFHVVAFRILTGNSVLYRAASIGYVGVSLFFVLSGFILAYTYEGTSISPIEFWRARFARVYPAYGFSLLAALPWFLYAATHRHWVFTHWPGSLKLGMLLQVFLLQAWHPALALMWNPVSWSLSVEAFFYLLFPFLLKRLTRLPSRVLILIGLFSWLASLAITGSLSMLNLHTLLADRDSQSFWLNLIKFNPLVRLPEFLVGMASGLHFLHARLNPKRGFTLIGAAILWIAVVVCFSDQLPYASLHSGLLAPVFASLIYGLALQPRFPAFLTAGPMILLGEASYSFYLLHFLSLAACYFGLKTDLRSWGVVGVLICFAVICVLSMLVYLFLEVPARRYLRGYTEPAGTARSSRASFEPGPTIA